MRRTRGECYTPLMKSSPTFDQQYARLNPTQKTAVDTIEGPVMVIAGPGTGKTTVLTLRIANILRLTDTPPHGILAITYTDAGVKAMRTKLIDIIGDRAHEVRIHTFHSFASSIMAEHADHFLETQGWKQMTDIDQELMIRSIIEDPHFADLRPLGKPDAYISSILRSIDTAKREAMTPKSLREYALAEIDRIEHDEGSISTRGATKGQLKADAKEAIIKCKKTILLTEVFEQYENRKREEHVRDFNDLITELLIALRTDELLLRLVQEQYLYIHIDEHQDTNDAQNFIVSIIAEFFETPNIFIVGDEKQAIYRFQGASVENFLRLQKQWPTMKILSLDTNYRSHQSILDASFGMIEHNYEGDEHANLRIKLNSGSTDKPRQIEVVTGENVTAMEEYLISKLKAFQSESDAARKNGKNMTAAIIVRRNRDIDRIIRLLESNSISVSSERSVDIFKHPAGALFFDLIAFFGDPTRSDLLAKTIISGMWDTPFEKAVLLVRNLRSGLDAETLSHIPGINRIRAKILSDSPVEFIIHVAEISGYISLIAREPGHVHVWRGIVTLAESLARDGALSGPLELIHALIAYRTSAESRTIKVSVGAPDASLYALTAHGSKGLEYDQVFIPYATEEAWVGKSRGSSFVLPKKQTDHDIRDTRRLFYVAVTRARSNVTILTGLEESDGKILTPVRFIAELDPAHVSQVSLPRIQKEFSTVLNIPTSSTDNSTISSPLLDLTKRILTESGLSVTALNNFVKCPTTFLYQSILKLPQAPSVSAEKGTAMHAGLSDVWNVIMKKRTSHHIEDGLTEDTKPSLSISNTHSGVDTELIQSTLISSLTNHIASCFLSRTEKEIVKKELIGNAPLVATALTPHFNTSGALFTESWVKINTDYSYNGQDISIPLHGKLDAIVDTGREVHVFDYKTKQAISINAIRGETKTDDGSYFRQLIFYTILLNTDARWKGKNVIPSLVFVSPDEKGRCPTITLPITPEDIERVKKEISGLVQAVWSGSILNTQCDDTDCEWCEFAKINNLT
jgi:DNA helicase-2/ATP-dependent DNA helicase PcrA